MSGVGAGGGVELSGNSGEFVTVEASAEVVLIDLGASNYLQIVPTGPLPPAGTKLYAPVQSQAVKESLTTQGGAK